MRRPLFAVMLALSAMTLLAFLAVANHEFVNLDDRGYITRNPAVRNGLSLHGVSWAFTSAGYMANWHPLTWLSHMLDVQVFGLDPRGHHLVNLVFHLANTLALFLVLQRMTMALWSSAFTAALFAVHPLHVESVAWVAERKDVLSTLLWLLTMLAYLAYVRKPGLGRHLLTAASFALGLLAKPMLVTLPLALLLLDFWPLGRISRSGGGGLRRVLLEKVPLLVLSACSVAVTLHAQGTGGSIVAIERLGLSDRLSNALVSYVAYIAKALWPAKLAAFYPYPSGGTPLIEALAAALLLAAVTVLVCRAWRRSPFLAVGWLWYLGTLVPVIGLVQVGNQAMADRYTYVPLIGLCIMLSWGGGEFARRLPRFRLPLAAAAGAALVSLMAKTWHQTGTWRDSESLARHALRVTTGNYLMEHNLAVVLVEARRPDEGAAHFAAALRLNPGSCESHDGLGNILQKQWELDLAVFHFREAVRICPDFAKAYNNLGSALMEQRRPDEAAPALAKALELDPGLAEAHYNLGSVLEGRGALGEALPHLREAVRLSPGDAYAKARLRVLERRLAVAPAGSGEARPR